MLISKRPRHQHFVSTARHPLELVIRTIIGFLCGHPYKNTLIIKQTFKIFSQHA